MRRHGLDRDVIVVEPDSGSSIGWLLFGAAVGAGLALLIAPASGAETRRRITRSARRLNETARDTVEEIEDTARAAVSRRRSGANQAREDLERRLADARARRRAEAEDQEPVA